MIEVTTPGGAHRLTQAATRVLFKLSGGVQKVYAQPVLCEALEDRGLIKKIAEFNVPMYALTNEGSMVVDALKGRRAA